MANYYKLAKPSSHESGVQAVVLAKDENGNVTKEARVGVAVELTSDEKSRLEERGWTVESATKAEAEKAEQQVVGSDVAASGPVFGDVEGAPAPDSPRKQGGNQSNDKNNK